MDNDLFILDRRVRNACIYNYTPRPRASDVDDLLSEVCELAASYSKAMRSVPHGSRPARRLQCVIAILDEYKERLGGRLRVLNADEHEIAKSRDYQAKLAARDYASASAPQTVDRGKPAYAADNSRPGYPRSS
jgi:hypothetical protein